MSLDLHTGVDVKGGGRHRFPARFGGGVRGGDEDWMVRLLFANGPLPLASSENRKMMINISLEKDHYKLNVPNGPNASFSTQALLV